MKKILLILLVLCNVNLFSQTNDQIYFQQLSKDNENLHNEIKKLDSKLREEADILKSKLREEVDGLDKMDFDIKLSLDSLAKTFENKIVKLEKILNAKADSQKIEDLNINIEKNFSSTKDKIESNSIQLNNERDKISKIKGTVEGQNNNIKTTENKVNKNNLYILLSFSLAILLLIACIVIYRITNKNKLNISTARENIKGIFELDKDLKNILEKHTKILESDSGQDSQEETLKSLKIVADEIMTMENNIYQMTEDEQNSRGLKRIKRAIQNLRNNYKTMGYDIPILLGTEWKEGDIIEIVSEIPDENIEKGKRIITRIVTPRIDFKGEMIQRAKVELKSNI